MNTEQKAKEYREAKFQHWKTGKYSLSPTAFNNHLTAFATKVLTDYQNQKQVDGVEQKEPKFEAFKSDTFHGLRVKEWNKLLSNKEKIEDHPKKVEEIRILNLKLSEKVENWNNLVVEKAKADARIKELEEGIRELVTNLPSQHATQDSVIQVLESLLSKQ